MRDSTINASWKCKHHDRAIYAVAVQNFPLLLVVRMQKCHV